MNYDTKTPLGMESSSADPLKGLITKAFHETNKSFSKIVYESRIALLSLLIPYLILNGYLSFLKSTYFTEGDPRSFIINLGSLLATGLIGITLLMIIPIRVKDYIKNQEITPIFSFFKKHSVSLTIETLRAHFFIFLWTLLFVLPGLIKQIRYLFMPYLVMFDERYQNDKNFDPIKESDHLVKGITTKLLTITTLIFLVKYFFQQLVERMNLLPSLISFKSKYLLEPSIILNDIISFIIFIYVGIFYFYIFLRKSSIAQKEITH